MQKKLDYKRIGMPFKKDPKELATWTDDKKRQTVVKIFECYESVSLGCAYEGITLTRYYKWRNQLFSDGQLTITKRGFKNVL